MVVILPKLQLEDFIVANQTKAEQQEVLSIPNASFEGHIRSKVSLKLCWNMSLTREQVQFTETRELNTVEESRIELHSAM